MKPTKSEENPTYDSNNKDQEVEELNTARSNTNLIVHLGSKAPLHIPRGPKVKAKFYYVCWISTHLSANFFRSLMLVLINMTFPTIKN